MAGMLLKKDLGIGVILGLIVCLSVFGRGLLHNKWPTNADMLTGYYMPWVDIAFEGELFPFHVKNLHQFDSVRQVIPFKYLAIEQWKKGVVPLWNTTQFSGTPLAADFLTGAFFVGNILFWIWEFAKAWAMLGMLQIFSMVFFVYIFLRSCKLSTLASFMGSITWGIGGFAAGFFYINSALHTLAWSTLAMTGINYMNKTSRKSVALTALGIGIAGTAAHLQLWIYMVAVIGLYAAYKKVSLRRCVLGIGLGIMITGVQLIPSIEFIMNSHRASNFDGVVENITSPLHHLLYFWFPNYYGNPGNWNYFGGPSYYHEYSFYIGVVGLMLAIVGMWSKQKDKFFWMGVVGIGLIMATNNWLTDLIFENQIPFVSTITPTRAYALVDLGLAVLSAIGIDAIIKKQRVIGGVGMFGLFSLVAIGVAFFNLHFPGSLFTKYLFDTTPANVVTGLRSMIVPTGLLIFGLVLGISALKLKHSKLVYLSLSLLVLLNGFDLSRQFGIQNGSFTLSSFFPKTKVTELLTNHKYPARVVSMTDQLLPANIGGVYGWETIAGYQAVSFDKYISGLIYAIEKGSGQKPVFTKMVSLSDPRTLVLDEFAVDYLATRDEIDVITRDPNYEKVLTEGEVKIFKNKNPKSRFSLATKGFDSVSDHGFLSEGRVATDSGSIAIVNYLPNKIELVAETMEKTALRSMVPNYPGWSAKVNGKKSDIIEDEYGFLGVKIDEGKSAVVFYFVPISFAVGLVVTLLGLSVTTAYILPERFWMVISPNFRS